jgi:hypothetical protein
MKNQTAYWIKLAGDAEEWQLALHVSKGRFCLFDAEGYFYKVNHKYGEDRTG